MFKSLLDSMLQCICDLWDAADSPEQKKLLVEGLEELVERFEDLERSSSFVSARTIVPLKTEPVNVLPSISNQAREMLSVILGSAGLLEKYEFQLTPERRLREFGKIRDAVQSFARLMDEATT